MSNQADLEKEFQQYNWNDDKDWQNILVNMDFPAEWDETKKEDFLLKRKRKYYQAKVNRAYVPPEASSTPKRSNPPVVEEAADSKRSGYEQKPNSSFSNKEANDPKKTAPKAQQTTTNDRGSKVSQPSFVQRVLNFYFLASQWLFLTFALASFVFPTLYYRAIMIIATVHVVALFQNTGRPQWDRYYVERVFRDENSMIAFQAGVLLLGPPSILFISPNLLRSLFLGSHMLSAALSNSGGLAGKIYPFLKPHLHRVTTQLAWFNSTIALLEVCVGVYLIACIFFMKGALFTVFLYWQILGTKYTLNANTKVAFAHVNQMIEGNLQRIPAVLNIYRKMTGYLFSMVDPQQMAARQAQAQSGTRSCVIM